MSKKKGKNALKVRSAFERRKVNSDLIVFHGKAVLGPASTTDSTGLAIIQSNNLDTDFTGQLNSLGQFYQYWRIRELRFKITSLVSTANPGMWAMCIVEDGDGVAPTTLKLMMVQKYSAYNTIYRHGQMVFVPTNTTWLYTQDNVASSDRLEMYGDFYWGTEYCQSAMSNPLILELEYTVEFKGLTDPNTQLSKVCRPLSEQPVKSLGTDDRDDKGEEFRLLRRLAELRSKGSG